MIQRLLSFLAGWESGTTLLIAGSLLVGAIAFALYWRQRHRGSILSDSLTQARNRLDSLQTRDSLTGLFSRAEFDRALEAATARCDQRSERLCVVVVDIDDQRGINDRFGLEGGDQVLREVARRLDECLGAQAGAAARVGADEFALLVPGDRLAGLEAALRIERRFEPVLQIGGRAERISCSIGIACYPEQGARQRLLLNAEVAMRSVKLLGGGAHAEYDPAMGTAQRAQAQLLHDLRIAIEESQFELYYQPKIDARSLQITAVEALVRWNHPQRGIVSPVVFIPLAERHGLIGAIGDWVIAEACRQAAVWRRSGLRMRVAINLSGAQLRRDDLVEFIQARLAEHAIPPGRLTCEITESVAMEDTRVTREAFARLGRAGIHVSIDDFGTGYSSLAALRRRMAAELKIDRAFVCDLETSSDARAIVQAIVQMAHTLELRVVAEGVETQGQRDLLVKMGCDELQGFLFARPMTAQALTLWASDERPASHAELAFRPSLFGETLPPALDSVQPAT
ncbi:MAG: bifunctional diguanylate cyclase/phosphodiesterase [Burkholderiales bacterium]|nr:bifunctional diguanylate cyclase/phosphodiesterase [Burkholderiales bacterium]MDE2395016.1 bifunctional diguanylate cyclase/phosphodiesterase [Burkholderiales bacterium]MDE2454559.1 bifunctional diguanylate cyclase/phosphodiesterase [Burkholderiales bacterium]